MKRLTWGRSGSLERTRSDLEIGPEKALVSTEVTIFPSPPGLMTLSNEATVQPQPGRASLMIRSEETPFLTTKVVSIICPFATTPASRDSGEISIRGGETALAAGAALAGVEDALGAPFGASAPCENRTRPASARPTPANLLS